MTDVNLRPVYLIDGLRTPFLKVGSRQGIFNATDLAIEAGKTLLLRQDFSPQDFDTLIMGSTIAKPQEANIARLIALRLHCGDHMPAWTVQRNCGSGLQSVDDARLAIASGRADLVLAGGTDAMSHAPFLLDDKMASWLLSWFSTKTWQKRLHLLSQLRPAFFAPVYSLLKGLHDPIVGLSMGQTAEILAERFDISREAMDTFSVESHQRLAKAIDQNHFPEIMPLFTPKAEAILSDQGLRRDSNVEKLGKLKPAFDKHYGLITAGNSSQISDGAALLILASEDAVKKHNLKPIAILHDCQWAGVNPSEMGLGPVKAMRRLLAKENLGVEDIDYWEINEAFSAQVLACVKGMGDPSLFAEEIKNEKQIGHLPVDKLNIKGGAVAIGHPIAASGTRLILQLSDILSRQKAKKGIASLCIGGGQGGAILIENLNGV